mmetsp:Transcript_51073/g.158338  ORF Transcript_51073/g.158338 Transcript_51073/m.158338 type:complete len:156 (-) Transcript_51073:210-677(-)
MPVKGAPVLTEVVAQGLLSPAAAAQAGVARGMVDEDRDVAGGEGLEADGAHLAVEDSRRHRHVMRPRLASGKGSGSNPLAGHIAAAAKQDTPPVVPLQPKRDSSASAPLSLSAVRPQHVAESYSHCAHDASAAGRQRGSKCSLCSGSRTRSARAA